MVQVVEMVRTINRSRLQGGRAEDHYSNAIMHVTDIVGVFEQEGREHNNELFRTGPFSGTLQPLPSYVK